MMTGQIIAGADPIQAVRDQLLILLSFMASAAITTVVLGFVPYPSLFSPNQQILHGMSVVPLSPYKRTHIPKSLASKKANANPDGGPTSHPLMMFQMLGH